MFGRKTQGKVNMAITKKSKGKKQITAKKAPRSKKAASPKKAPVLKKVSPKKKPAPSMIDIAERERVQATYIRPTEAEKPAPGSGKGKIVFISALILAVVVITAFLFKPLKELLFKSGPTTTKTDESKIPKTEKITEEVMKPVKEIETALPDKNVYIVLVKDSIIGISEKLTGDYRNWKKIYDANREIIKSPVLIYPGQKLRIPEDLNSKK